MSQASRADTLHALTASAAHNGGTPDYNAVATATGRTYQSVFGLWRRERAKVAPSVPTQQAAPPPVAPPPSPMPVDPDAPDPATCTESEFFAWRVRDLSADLVRAKGANQWTAVTGLSKQLAEARAALQRAQEHEADTTNLGSDEEFVRRLDLAMHAQPEWVWEQIVALAEEHYKTKLLVPRMDGGKAMLLTEDGWKSIGPELAWSEAFELSPQVVAGE